MDEKKPKKNYWESFDREQEEMDHSDFFTFREVTEEEWKKVTEKKADFLKRDYIYNSLEKNMSEENILKSWLELELIINFLRQNGLNPTVRNIGRIKVEIHCNVFLEESEL
ncbi:hypothetical protein V1387_04285 [Allomuricauda taeanensis]|uniref:hypothetical protein n=1 Tax=Flagellimonas taeanensis TaxID=1005926 RepID=UPI002E7B8C32|nr:hypothetical protein [Allomuricauda taeanensis]MEE1961893.1 hypothetical protein [Allomuricauda taeanensis]